MSRTRLPPPIFAIVLLAVAVALPLTAAEPPQYENPFKNLPQHVLDELAAGGEVTIDHTYEHGVRTKSKYRGADWYLLDRTVDPSGVVLSERDAAGLEIAYDYDQLHRVTAVKPSAAHGGAWVQIRHSIVETGPKMELFYRPNGSMTATPIAREELYFDGFGRLWKERRLMPGAVWAERITERHASGELKRVSTWHGGGKPARWTTYENYDAFGRPGRITQPDGARVDYTYRGIREIVRTQQVATSEHGQTAYSTIERYDARGRLLKVIEPEGGAEATYTYDVAGRLRVAKIKPRGGGASQTRRWAYDGRGFLLSEEHPESGRAEYGLYDARGRAHRVIDGTSDLLFAYDEYERLVEVRETGSDRPWQSFIYGTSGRSTNRLIEAIGHNWIRIPWAPSLVTDVAVTERYAHDGLGGAVSRKTTAVSGGQRFTQAWQYDALGDVTKLTYPRCTHAACANDDGAGPSSAQTRGYSRGYLVSVPGFLNGIDYDVSGMATRIDHTSGLRVDVVPDASGLPRPRDIRAYWPAGWPGAAEESKNVLAIDDPLFIAQGAAALGAHRFDGSGNVRARGAEWYTFDGANRLRSFNLGSGSKQAYRFDGFGNLNRITTDGIHRTLPISTASNRLATGVYDAAGNLAAWAGETYGFDVLDRMQTRNFPERTHVFTVDGERLFTFDWDPVTGAIAERWTLRDLDGSVLTTYETDGGNAGIWRWTQDYVYRDGTMLASRVRFDDGSIGVRDYVVDHLGTPRLIGDRYDGLRTQHFFGFGEPIDLAASIGDSERKRFTGHERDLGTLSGNGSVQVELDYMRMRFCSPWTARFLSVDPAQESAQLQRPQTWNRYSYAYNNPVTLVDPDGEAALKADLQQRSKRLIDRNQRLRTALKSRLERVPRIGSSAALIGDSLLAGMAPMSTEEFTEASASMVNPVAAISRAPADLLKSVSKFLIGSKPQKIRFKSGGSMRGAVQVNTQLPGGANAARKKYLELTGELPSIQPGERLVAQLSDGTEVQMRIKLDGTGKIVISSTTNRLQEKITFLLDKE